MAIFLREALRSSGSGNPFTVSGKGKSVFNDVVSHYYTPLNAPERLMGAPELSC